MWSDYDKNRSLLDFIDDLVNAPMTQRSRSDLELIKTETYQYLTEGSGSGE